MESNAETARAGFYLAATEVVRIGNEFERSQRLGKVVRRRAAVAGSPGVAWTAELQADDFSYLAKWKKDAFPNPLLEQLLAERDLTRINLAALLHERASSRPPVGCSHGVTKLQ
jgi:hypothetical protein